ncbi:MAG: 6-bladed beta-propeller [Balneolaceae bacterium]
MRVVWTEKAEKQLNQIFHMIKKYPNGILVIFLTLLSLACSGNSDIHTQLSDSSFQTLQLNPVFEFTESDEIAFQQINSVKSNNERNIIVHDFRQPFLFMFDEIGNFLKTIGREGQGPGEFQQIMSFMITQDQLWVIDSRTNKIEKFEYQDTEYVHVKSISLEKNELAGVLLGKTEEGFLIKNRYTIHANRKDNPTEQSISLINENGKILRDPIFMASIPEQVTAKGSGNTLNAGKSFGNRSLLAFDGMSQVYSLWTDSLSIDTYSIEGDHRYAFSHPLEPVRITDEEINSAINRYNKIFHADLRRQLPDVKPVVNNLIMDDHQRIWVELLTEGLGHGWFCFTKEGEPLYKIDIPMAGTELQEIHQDRVLWNYLNEDGAPTIAVSEINIPEI